MLLPLLLLHHHQAPPPGADVLQALRCHSSSSRAPEIRGCTCMRAPARPPQPLLLAARRLGRHPTVMLYTKCSGAQCSRSSSGALAVAVALLAAPLQGRAQAQTRLQLQPLVAWQRQIWQISSHACWRRRWRISRSWSHHTRRPARDDLRS
jgi:hypothetical protein